MYRRYPILFLALAAGVVAPYALLTLALTGSGPFGGGDSSLLSFLLIIGEWLFVGPLISALHLHAVLLIDHGTRPRLAEVARRGIAVLPSVALATLIASVGIVGGFLCLIVPGVVLMLQWAVVAQTAAVGQQGWKSALERSRRLTDGHYRYIFGLMVVGAAISFGIWAPLRAVAHADASLPNVLLGIAATTLTQSFTALIFAILYLTLAAPDTPPPQGPPA